MNELTVLNGTNVALGLATIVLWSVLISSVVQEMIDRRRQRDQEKNRPALHLVPPPRKAA